MALLLLERLVPVPEVFDKGLEVADDRVVTSAQVVPDQSLLGLHGLGHSCVQMVPFSLKSGTSGHKLNFFLSTFVEKSLIYLEGKS